MDYRSAKACQYPPGRQSVLLQYETPSEISCWSGPVSYIMSNDDVIVFRSAYTTHNVQIID